SDLRSSCLVRLSFGEQCGDVLDGVPGASFGAADALEAAPVDEVPDGAGAGAESAGDIAGAVVAGWDELGVHDPMMGQRCRSRGGLRRAVSGRIRGLSAGVRNPKLCRWGPISGPKPVSDRGETRS